ncbi:MAG: hypothetical protein MUO97_07680 [Dehalococcoidia bacterium]|nr:hypothetical protein [Dehalococcoidia bacterium]
MVAERTPQPGEEQSKENKLRQIIGEEIRTQIEKSQKAKDMEPPPVSKEELAVEERGSGRKGQVNMSGGLMKTAIVSALVTLVVIVGMGMMGGGTFVTKADFTKNITGMNTAVQTAVAEVSQKQAEINTVIQGIPAQVNNAVASVLGGINNQLSSISSSVSGLASTVDSLSSTVGTLDTQLKATNAEIVTQAALIKALQDKVTALEAKFTPTPGATSPITVESRIVGKNYAPIYAADGVTITGTTITFGVKLVLTNKEARDLEDIELEVPIEIETDGNITSWTEATTNWNLSDKSIEGTYAEAFLEGNSITLDSSDTKKITVSMTVVAAGNISDISVDINDDDIEVVDWGYE